MKCYILASLFKKQINSTSWIILYLNLGGPKSLISNEILITLDLKDQITQPVHF